MKLITLLPLFLLAGCSIHMDLPDRFLELERNGFEIRATSSDEAMIWVRTFDTGVEEDGSLDFWADALSNNLVQNRGYRLVETKDIAASGRPGKAMILAATVGGEVHRELVAVFVKGRFWGGQTVCTVEFVAPEAQFERDIAEVEAKIASLSF